MTPQEFIEKWGAVELKERSASQSHFNDLCHLLGLKDPTSADGKGEWFTYEKGASKTSGGEGWADVWRKDCFAWEYKGKKANLDKAFDQLLQYSIALENPPLLIVSDMDVIRIHTNWTNTVQNVHTITLADLTDAANRDLLRDCFQNPERLKPAKTRQHLTEEAAEKFAGLAQRLRARGHVAEVVAHFVNRLVFCMFAEDVQLLPNKMFQRVLEHSLSDPSEFQENAQMLFAAMASKDIGKVGLEKVEWFNGGLFDDDHALPLEKADVADLLDAARLDWSDIDPSILGTLFERGLDPDKRSQLGAHYTDRDKIMMIVNPVIVEPLLAEWAGVKTKIADLLDKAPKATKDKLLRGAELAAATRAQNEAEKMHRNFIERLKAFRVLDPACGSGNFLYLALLELKNIEHRANLEAEALGLPRAFPTIGPECVKGIELNPYAAELARVSVWIGEIQWMRRNGFEAANNPILRPLGTIECRDAVLSPDGTRADWPEVDVVVGNPPFLGGKLLRESLGDSYVDALFAAWRNDVKPEADLVLYWFSKAGQLIRSGRLIRAGLVSTNSIRGGANRATLQVALGEGRIFCAWGDEPWVVEGAAVRVSLVCFDGGGNGGVRFEGQTVEKIFTDLTAMHNGAAGTDLTKAVQLAENSDLAFQGFKFGGPFEIGEKQAEDLLKRIGNPNGRPNSEVVRLWFNGMDITRRPERRWCIDFGIDRSEADAMLFEAPYTILAKAWKAENDTRHAKRKRPLRHNEPRTKEEWWLHQRPRPELRIGIRGLPRFIATPEVAKHRLFVWFDAGELGSGSVYSIARDDDTTFGILHSRFHELWALRMGTTLEDRPRYTPSTTFETFPFPEGLTPNIPAADYTDNPRAVKIAAAAARMNELRQYWLNPADLVKRVPEVVPGYPDRILPVDDAAAKELKKRTLTNLYNACPAWLDHAHKALDEAVADAYGWGDDWRAGTLTDDEILARLFHLNQERAAKEKSA